MNKEIAIIIPSVMIIVLMGGILLLAADRNPEAEAKVATEPPRFTEVSRFAFDKYHKATIYLDTQTEIEYLHIQQYSRNSGGPAITRLWKK